MMGNDIMQNNTTTNWADPSDNDEWDQEPSVQSGQDLHKSQSWGDQPRNNFRSRGPRRGNSNNYNNGNRGNNNYNNGRSKFLFFFFYNFYSLMDPVYID